MASIFVYVGVPWVFTGHYYIVTYVGSRRHVYTVTSLESFENHNRFEWIESIDDFFGFKLTTLEELKAEGNKLIWYYCYDLSSSPHNDL